MIFYIIVQSVKNIFPKFRVNRSKILGERERETLKISSHSDAYRSPFILKAFFSKLYF